MRRKKVVILTNTMSHGGAQRVAVRLANALAERHDVYFMAFANEHNYSLSDKVKNLDCGAAETQIKRRWGCFSRFVSRVRGFIFFSKFRLRERPDASLSFMGRPDALNILAPAAGKRILSERNNPMKKGKAEFRSSLRRLRFADTVVFQSELVKNMYPESIRKKGVVIPNPVEVECMAAPERGKRIVTAGRYHPQKNHVLLFRAFSAFLENHPGYTLHLYGEGDLHHEYEELIRSLSLQGKVFLEGFRNDIHKAISDAAMFVMSSDFEGMPNALFEAMMMGLPCITTAFPGVEEFIGDSGSCLITPVGDSAALRDAMASLADDPELNRSLGVKAAEYTRKYSMDRIIPLWEEVL